MPAFESRRVRTQPFTVTGASCGALPDKIVRTLNALSSIASELSWSSVKSQLNVASDQTILAVRKLTRLWRAIVDSRKKAAWPADAYARENLEVAVRRCGICRPSARAFDCGAMCAFSVLRFTSRGKGKYCKDYLDCFYASLDACQKHNKPNVRCVTNPNSGT